MIITKILWSNSISRILTPTTIRFTSHDRCTPVCEVSLSDSSLFIEFFPFLRSFVDIVNRQAYLPRTLVQFHPVVITSRLQLADVHTFGESRADVSALLPSPTWTQRVPVQVSVSHLTSLRKLDGFPCAMQKRVLRIRLKHKCRNASILLFLESLKWNENGKKWEKWFHKNGVLGARSRFPEVDLVSVFSSTELLNKFTTIKHYAIQLQLYLLHLSARTRFFRAASSVEAEQASAEHLSMTTEQMVQLI